ncbi:MAG TPA: sodium/solute symporter, partial [Candidatus Methylacidiphilales bacterium]
MKQRIFFAAIWTLWLALEIFASAAPEQALKPYAPGSIQVTPFSAFPLVPAGAAVGRVAGGWIIAGGFQKERAPTVSSSVLFLPEGASKWQQSVLAVPFSWSAVILRAGAMRCYGGLGVEGPIATACELRIHGNQLEQTELSPLPFAVVAACAIASGDDDIVLGGTLLSSVPNRQVMIRGTIGERVQVIPEGAASMGGTLFAGNDHSYLVGGFIKEGDSLVPMRAVWQIEKKSGRLSFARRPEPSPILGVVSAAPMGQNQAVLIGDPGAVLPGPPTLEPTAYAPVCYDFSIDRWVTFSDAFPPDAIRIISAPDQPYLLAAEQLYTVRPGLNRQSFSLLDYLVCIGTTVGIALIGFASTKKVEASAGEFLLGGRHIPAWAAGISVFATRISAVSFMLVPATAFGTNLLIFGSVPISIIAGVSCSLLFIRYLRRIQITTIFEYLERRFNRTVRLLGALILVVSQIVVKIGLVLYLPAVAISAATGIPSWSAILFMGIIATAYTTFGGMEAVIWTDVVQGILMFFGAGIVIFVLLSRIDGGWHGFLEVNAAYDKFKMYDFSSDIALPVFWVVFVSVIFQQISKLGDQIVLQRVFTTKDEFSALKSDIYGNLIDAAFQILFWVLIGLGLFVYFHDRPERVVPFQSTDSVFPHFIVEELPHGLSGLLIASLLAAAMSHLSGSINSTAAVVLTDLVKPYRGIPMAADSQVRLLRWASVGIGFFSSLMALVLNQLALPSLFVVWQMLVALVGGGFPAIMFLGLVTRRANSTGAIVGCIASIVITAYVQFFTQINFFLDNAIAVGTAIICGY